MIESLTTRQTSIDLIQWRIAPDEIENIERGRVILIADGLHKSQKHLTVMF